MPINPHIEHSARRCVMVASHFASRNRQIYWFNLTHVTSYWVFVLEKKWKNIKDWFWQEKCERLNLRKSLGPLMDKMFGKIQHQLGVEGTGPAGFKIGVRIVACISRGRSCISHMRTFVLWCSRDLRGGLSWWVGSDRLMPANCAWGHWCCDVRGVEGDLNWLEYDMKHIIYAYNLASPHLWQF